MTLNGVVDMLLTTCPGAAAGLRYAWKRMAPGALLGRRAY
jgi:hypothetical protein